MRKITTATATQAISEPFGKQRGSTGPADVSTVGLRPSPSTAYMKNVNFEFVVGLGLLRFFEVVLYSVFTTNHPAILC